MSENLTYIEMSARLHFSENHIKYLSSELAKSTAKIEELENEVKRVKELEIELNRITELLKLAVKKTYSPSSEKTEANGQLSFLEEDENKEKPASERCEVKSYTRAPKRKYEDIYKNLPTEIKEYDLADTEKICNECGAKMVCIGYESCREIEYTPAILKVIEHRRKKYACKSCDQNALQGSIKTASAPQPLIDHGIASPSLITHIICEKFVKAVPLYRLEQWMHSMGANLSRQSMSNWLIAAAELLRPLYDLFRRYLIAQDIIHADETPLQVNRVEDHKKPVNGYVWVYRSGRFSGEQIILYDYRNGRKGDYPAEFLKGFSGFVHCDGLRQYDEVINAVRVGCWAHVRRYFKDALDVQPDKRDHTTLAGEGFLKIQEIFAAETAKDERFPYSLDEIAAIRKEKSRILTENFFKWCEKNQGIAVPKSLTGKAIKYALGQKKSLTAFLEDPRLELTNNAAERAVKPFVIGRKNWLFANTEKGANAAALLYSVVETAKACKLKVFDYLKWVFEGLRSCDFTTFEDFLPWKDAAKKFKLEDV